ncbi:MAG: aminotransferase class III-fold pyridoxal phosphate-dependent enzyme [Eudoraea sp.]|nr:aminotransferase class III-fold pyridoxal phosphate-dependent enzyme [Bacteroidia bacterium]NND16913.1 aminotransferase class III-fold pyridoxal phosphate-dependent enzyme [Eudoraea sp.]
MNDQILRDNLDYTLFSWSKQGGLNPINMERAKGVYLWDRSGKKYIDFSSQLMNVNIGHGNQRVAKAVSDQMKALSFVAPSIATMSRGDLGKKLAEITPGNLTKSFFTLGGAEAIENAVKIARIYSGKSKIIGQYRSYHGATYTAMSAGGDPRKHAIDAFGAANYVHVENPYYYRCPWNTDSPEACGEMALRNLEQVIQYENPDSIAAIIMEGESGTSGCIKYPPFYLKKVRELANEYGILMICDEVMSGFGRTGKWFGVDHHGVTPDIMAVAKGITSGYLPLGATIVSDKIAHYFDDKPMYLGLTYSAHAVLCAAAIENLKIIEEDGLLLKAEMMGAYIERKINDMKDIHPSIGDFRNTGLLGCIEMVKDRKTKEPVAPWNGKGVDLEVTHKVASKIRDMGMFTFVKWNFIFIAPPLIITKKQVDEGLDIISQALTVADQYYTGT